jgi:hypothetical protein
MSNDRRFCPACLREYVTTPVSAAGGQVGKQAFLVTCSWACLVQEIRRQRLAA